MTLHGMPDGMHEKDQEHNLNKKEKNQNRSNHHCKEIKRFTIPDHITDKIPLNFYK